MSKGIKTIASIALPIIGNVIAPGIGGAIGGALGGAISGGGLTGMALGALGGYASGNAVNGLIGNAAGAPLATVTGNAALQGPTMGSGIMGAVTGGGVRALGQGVTSALTSAAADPSKLLLGIGNQLVTMDSARTAEKAARTQSDAINSAIQTQQPYTQAGADAIGQINKINADPAGYIQGNPLYASLASDAQRRLMANQAAKGKVGSGGTAAALQDQLLQIGNGLVQQQIGNLQNQAGIGQNAANVTSNLQTSQGNVNAAGQVGSQAAYKNGYQSQMDMLLAMNNLNKVPSYSPTQMVSL